MAYTANISVLKQAYDNSRPTTYDYLRPNAFRFTIRDLPNTSFTCQSANLPSLALGNALQPTPFVDIPTIGDKLLYGDFTMRFIITEDMSNYIEIYKWLVALGFPNDYTQFETFAKLRPTSFPFIRNKQNNLEVLAYSDGTLTILDSTNNPKINIIFKELFPISLEALDYDVTSPTVNYLTAIAAFRYKLFEIESL
jgi:hypothetical protein